MTRPRVLFLCTGSSARSQMAEVFLKKYVVDRSEAHCVGLDPKGINPYTRWLMAEIGCVALPVTVTQSQTSDKGLPAPGI